MPFPTDAMIKRLGSVNCLSLAAKDGVETRLCRLALSMFRLKIDILFVCETKRNAWFGEKRFDPDNKVTCLFGDFNKTAGVGFLMANHLKKFIVYSKFIGTRLGRVDFNMGGFIVACIVVYAPIQCSDQKLKDLFYKELEEMCNLEAYDKLIIGGDFNGRIGSNYRKKEARLSFAKVTNCNGDLLSTFAKNQKLKIVNMLFPKSKMKRWTWASALSDNNHKDVNKLAELDYFLCSSSRGILDFRVIPSHLLDIDTDHRMIVMDVAKAFVGKSLSGKIKIGKTMLLNITRWYNLV